MSTEHLNGEQALARRMASLLLVPPEEHSDAPGDVTGVVQWFGAMQAQDLNSALWSLGLRLPGSRLVDVEAAMERRDVLRTWPMRGTVHIVPAKDAHWMLDVLGQRALAGAERRRAFLGLEQHVADRAVDILGTALAGGGRLTRGQCMQTLKEAGIDSAGQLGYHLLWYASQRGVTCIAPNVGKEQSFVLLDEWVPQRVDLDREEALATIALRYFQSHGPVRRQDFAGWTGLTMADADRGITGAGDALRRVVVDGVAMVAAAKALDSAAPDGWRQARALPGFDEYMLGFKDRSLMLSPGDVDAVVPGSNGMFRATLVHAGRVVATWKRTLSGRCKVVVEAWPLRRLPARARTEVEDALEPYATYLDRTLDVRWS